MATDGPFRFDWPLTGQGDESSNARPSRGRNDEMSTLAVVEEILRETAIPMSVKEIVERAGTRLPSKSKTPDTVVARDLSMDIKKKGEGSQFVRTSPGRYTMRDLWRRQVPVASAGAVAQPMTVEGTTTSVLASAMRQDRASPLPVSASGRTDGGSVGVSRTGG